MLRKLYAGDILIHCAGANYLLLEDVAIEKVKWTSTSTRQRTKKKVRVLVTIPSQNRQEYDCLTLVLDAMKLLRKGILSEPFD